MRPRVEALCIGKRKGERKRPVDSAEFLIEHGIRGDAHQGKWHRQVSILSMEDINMVRKKYLPGLKPGDFAENINIACLDLTFYGLGTRLRLGQDVVLSITQIGKICHSPCRINELTGDCIMPRLGLFARVESEGFVRVGDTVEATQTVSRDCFQTVVLTISDRCSRGEAQDTAGTSVCTRLIESLDVHIYSKEILPDEIEDISSRLKHYCDGHSIDLVITVGGTGFSPRDVTPEATRTVIERFTPGIDEAMRASSLSKTPNAMLSRGTSGIRNSTLIINLPGSRIAALENLDVITDALKHGLLKLRGDTTECGKDKLLKKK